MPRIRRIALGLWVLLVVTLTVLYAVNPELVRPEGLVDALRQSGQPVLLAYVVLSVVRAFTLIPSTVLIIEVLGLGGLFERTHARRVRWLEQQMNQKGFWLVVGWSAFPFVPTDVICYVAGTLRMHLGKFAAGVALGEVPIVGFYVWAGGMVFGG